MQNFKEKNNNSLFFVVLLVGYWFFVWIIPSFFYYGINISPLSKTLKSFFVVAPSALIQILAFYFGLFKNIFTLNFEYSLYELYVYYSFFFSFLLLFICLKLIAKYFANNKRFLLLLFFLTGYLIPMIYIYIYLMVNVAQ